MEVMAMVDLATDMARGPLMLRLSRGWDTGDSMATVVLVLAMGVMAMVDLDTATERGLLMLRPSPRPMPIWDMVDSTATVGLVLVMADSDTDMARGPLMLRLSPRPMPITDMVAFTATDSQLMAATAMDSMARSKQNQIPRLTIS